MRIIKTSNSILDIGHQGENLATRVVFPAREWRTLFGDNGTFQLLAQRKGDENPYPVSLTIDGENIYWDITSSDTAIVGQGKCELQYYLGEILAKSEIWVTKTSEALGEAGEAPEPYQSWVDEVLEAGATAELSAIMAQRSAEDAEDSAQAAQESADSITNMTVSAHSVPSSQEANVEKTIDPITGYVNLDFEIPRGSGGGSDDFSVTVNDEQFHSVDGDVNIGTVLREHQSLSAYRTAADQDVIDSGKQNVITDLSEIRAGAALGSTAYQKHADGIPYSDLSDGVQDSLDLADTALQEHQSLSAYRTAAQQDVIDASKVSSVNGQNPDTDGNVYLDSSMIPNSNTYYGEFISDAIDYISSEATGKMPLPIIKDTMDSTPQDNTIYYLGLQTAINFAMPSSPSQNEHFRVVFYSGMTKTTVSITGDYYGEILPYMNHRVSCDFIYDGTAWSVVTIQIPTYLVYGFCGEPSVNAGKDVMWGITENNDLVIYGDGAMASNYASAANQPWAQYQHTIRTITVDAGVTTIGKEAFRNIRNATSVSLVDGLTSIGGNAFYGCNGLPSVIIPNSVTSLGANSFYNCSSLSSLQISESITVIPNWIFAGCSALTSVTIPQGVTRLGDRSFQNCLGLVSITIPNSVTTIGTSAFTSTPVLQHVYYNGTKAQWQAISVSTGNEQLSVATIHCTDGDITPA